MKIGILGGTFDPIHNGHLALAEHARKQFKLDRVLFIPAARPPHKRTSRKITPIARRLAMVRRAVSQFPKFTVSTLEIARKGPSYTVDTLRTLRQKYPKAELFLILGQDSYDQLDSWREPEAIRALVRILVAGRPGVKMGILKKGRSVFRIRMSPCALSASGIREEVKRGLRVDDDIPPRVLKYIRAHHLYGQES